MFTAAGALTPGGWHHVAATYDGATVRLYVDGAQVTSGSLSTPLATNTNVYLSNSLGPAVYAQDVDEVAIYNYALGAARILAHYNAAQ